VRRIEAVTGPVAVGLLRHHDRELAEAAALLRTRSEDVTVVIAEREAKRRELEKQARSGGGSDGGQAVSELAGRAHELGGVNVLIETAAVADAKALLELADRLKNSLVEPSAIVLGAAVDGRVHLIASMTPGAVERGLRAGALVKTAAQVVGGGGGGRDTMAQAGGRDPDKLPDALGAARAEIEQILSG
jgi:alanyl-tRNA synthetase